MESLEKIQQNKSKVMGEQATTFLKKNALAKMSDIQIVKLVDAGCDVNVPDKNGETLLGHVVGAGKVELADQLLQNGAKLDLKTFVDKTEYINIPYIKLNMSGGDTTIASTLSLAPIIICSIGGTLIPAASLFGGFLVGAALSTFITSFVVIATVSEHKDGTGIFKKNYWQIPRKRGQKMYPLELAIENQNTAMIEKLSDYAKGQESRILMEKMEAEKSRQQAIQKVKDKVKGFFSFVPNLVKNVYSMWQVRVATKRLANFNFVKGKAEDFKSLIARGANVNVLDKTKCPLLVAAAEKKRSDILEIILDNDVPVNVQNEKGWTAGMFVAQAGDVKMVQRLLDLGADVNIVNDYGKTMLMYAAKSGCCDIVKNILSRDSETMEIMDKENKTALFYAVQSGNRETVQAFLDEDVNADVIDKSGKTNLMYATRQNKYAIAKMLLDYGVETDVVDNSGKNAWDYVRKNDTKAVALLEGALKPWKEKFVDDLNCGKKESALAVLKKEGLVKEDAGKKMVGLDIKQLGDDNFALGCIFETNKGPEKYWQGEITMLNLNHGRGLSLETVPVLVHSNQRFKQDITDIPTKDFLSISGNKVVISLNRYANQSIDLPRQLTLHNYNQKAIMNNTVYVRA